MQPKFTSAIRGSSFPSLYSHQKAKNHVISSYVSLLVFEFVDKLIQSSRNWTANGYMMFLLWGNWNCKPWIWKLPTKRKNLRKNFIASLEIVLSWSITITFGHRILEAMRVLPPGLNWTQVTCFSHFMFAIISLRNVCYYFVLSWNKIILVRQTGRPKS